MKTKLLIMLAFLSACMVDDKSGDTTAMSDDIESIGSATMTNEGVIQLTLRADNGEDVIGSGYFEYVPNDPDYQNVIVHLGGIKPGENKPVPPWQDD